MNFIPFVNFLNLVQDSTSFSMDVHPTSYRVKVMADNDARAFFTAETFSEPQQAYLFVQYTRFVSAVNLFHRSVPLLQITFKKTAESASVQIHFKNNAHCPIYEYTERRYTYDRVAFCLASITGYLLRQLQQNPRSEFFEQTPVTLPSFMQIELLLSQGLGFYLYCFKNQITIEYNHQTTPYLAFEGKHHRQTIKETYERIVAVQEQITQKSQVLCEFGISAMPRYFQTMYGYGHIEGAYQSNSVYFQKRQDLDDTHPILPSDIVGPLTALTRDMSVMIQ